jgi:2-furoyl-CoA dehydrogenase large subunit
MRRSTMKSKTEAWVGKGMERREDARFLTGRGKFLDDMRLPGMKHAAILRSPHAHAKISSIDFSAALELPGVIDVVTGEYIKAMSNPFPCGVNVPTEYYSCAVDRVRYVGEPVAVAVAENRYIAEDALDQIIVEYDVLEPVMDIEKAVEPDAPILHDNIGSNVYAHRDFQYGDFEGAVRQSDITVEGRYYFNKFGSTPLETYVVVGSYNPFTEEFEVYSNYQGPFVNHSLVCIALGVPENKMRWIIPTDIGGGFGNKTGLYPYAALMALVAKKTGMTVKWNEDRREHLLASATGTDRVTYIKAYLSKEGKILALKDKVMDSPGGYIRPPEPGCSFRSTGNHTGCYQIENLDRDVSVVATNKGLTAPNRGYGCGHLYFSLEGIVDKAARKLGMDPAEIRMKNFIQPDQFPYMTATGGIYDSGDYPRTLQLGLDMIKYDEMRAFQEEARKQGRLVGIGLATVIDPSVTNIAYVTLAKRPEDRKEKPKSGSGESMLVKIDPLGKVHVIACTNPQGQGHETVICQIVADELGVIPGDVTVHNVVDTHQRVFTITTGSYSSRFASVGTTALVKALRKLKKKILFLAADMLGVGEDELEFVEGKVRVKADPDRAVALRHIAGRAHWDHGGLPDGVEPALYASVVYSMPQSKAPDEDDKVDSSNTYGFTGEAIVVEIDRDTGEIKFLKWASFHDAGTILNPPIVQGQVMGSIAHAIGSTLYEELAYNDNGQCLTASFQDYLVPTAMEIPRVEMGHIESPSPFTALGSKGCGEASTESTPAAIANAITDALSPLGIEITELPISPSKLWHMIQEAENSN